MRGRDESAWKAVIFDPSLPEDQETLSSLRSSGEVWASHDTLPDQLLALAETRHPEVRCLSPAERQPVLEPLVQEYLDGRSLDHIGRWIFYPWSGELVHLLEPEAYRELRLDRNRNKITTEDQQRLANLSVGIVGLSVGNAVALSLALEGIGGHLRLADFDHLELTNMNRLRAGCHELGLPKTVLAARQIAEIDPWLQVTLFNEGIRRDNVDEFFSAEPALDVLVEECDSVDVKLLVRERARDLRVPVVMETSDGGVLDVERFDLEPDRPVFHGLLGEMETAEVADMTVEQKSTIAATLLEPTKLPPRLIASVPEIGRTLSTWPQLGGDVALGGAAVTAAVRAFGRGEPLPSGRRRIDLDSLVRTGVDPTVGPAGG